MTSATQVPPAKGSEGSSSGRRAIRSRSSDLTHRFGLVLVWIVVIIVFSVLRPDTFATANNFKTILSTQAIPLFMALGLVPALAASEYDLSVGGVMGLSLVLVGYLNVTLHWAIGAAVAVALASGVVVGAINAFFIIVLEIESLVVTLGMGTLLAGAALGIQSLPVSGVSQSLVDVSTHEIAGIELVFYYGLIVTAVLWYVLSYTPVGRYLYFVGEGRNVARLSGIRVDAIRAGALIASSTVCAVAGVLQAGLIGGADPTIGPTLVLPAFAAAFLGATAIIPGRFNAWGVFVAVYFLATGIVGLQLLGLSGWIEQVFYGAALVLAVAVSRIINGRGRHRLFRRRSRGIPNIPTATGEAGS
jgi:ribose transport system permease protein